MAEVSMKDPDALVNTQWLAEHLDDPRLRIFDCSTILELDVAGERPYRVVSCRPEHEAGHIPGAGFFDLQADFSDDSSPFAMTLADRQTVAAAFGAQGIDDTSRVVLYSRRSMSWSTRFWWMLRWLGFDNAAVLDGGFEKWTAEGRPLSQAPCAYPTGQLSIDLRPEIFVAKDDVLRAIDDPGTCLVNALGRDVFSGENPRYGRPGRIPGSVSLPQVELVAPDGTFLSPSNIANALSEAMADKAQRHITYCGGGIFATVDAFWLCQLGHENVAVYENSMSEWGPNERLPIETDTGPSA
ncbi:sulfurtransferase [Yoonia sediminilitoris]|uniref:Thiosulfate/3-mercaptopyruvate sulfurtransferase n=1 Tax=Yoonia sediminilitoris TaxID=1286148 RepID=A0A2T6K4A7_9RHOB|nr:sulfurtransferase [Yoonia sediminilitoris]PUB09489.1 thiosulfate/3-mercaptopyruvate sulfurtransferase [Yoonia sediminilitoris]RCW89482.1 thiosulfate/3-mercaptopyruvate sulfurtransferase [Yoonia sediminilitoris]